QGVLANLAIAILGKAVVNLDDSASSAQIRSALGLCRVRHVLTSRAFTAQRPLPADSGIEVLFIEDLAARITRRQRFRMTMASLLLPKSLLERWMLGVNKHTSGDLLTVVVRDDGQGNLKAIRLTHRNVTAN